MSFSAAGFSRHTASGRRVFAGLFALAGLLVVLVALQARESVRDACVKSWVVQAENLGRFADAAHASRSELLLVERLTRLARRDDVAYALIVGSDDGRARFHTNPADVGRKYDSVHARRALSATETVIQTIPSHGVIEVDVPLKRGVLRVGFTFASLDGFFRWLWGGVALACGFFFLAVLAVLRPA